MKRIKWVNVIEIIILMMCTVLILSDIYNLMFRSYSFTWFGLITFISVIIQGSIIFEDLENKIKIALKN